MTVPISQRKTNRERPLVAALRVTYDEMDQLRADARQQGQSISEYLRSVVLDQRALTG